MNKLKYKEFFNKEFNEEEVMKNTYIDNNLKIKKLCIFQIIILIL